MAVETKVRQWTPQARPTTISFSKPRTNSRHDRRYFVTIDGVRVAVVWQVGRQSYATKHLMANGAWEQGNTTRNPYLGNLKDVLAAQVAAVISNTRFYAKEDGDLDRHDALERFSHQWFSANWQAGRGYTFPIKTVEA